MLSCLKPSETHDPRKLAKGDLLLGFLVRFNVSPVLLGFFYVSLLYMLRFSVALSTGYLWSRGEVMGFVEDPSVYTNFVIGWLAFSYYAWMPSGIADVFNGLRINGIVGEPITDDLVGVTGKTKPRKQLSFAEFTADNHKIFGKWIWPLGAAVLSAIVSLTMTLPAYIKMGDSAWYTATPYGIAVAVLWAFLLIFFLLNLFISSIIGIARLVLLFHEFKIIVRPLSPDKVGGLAPLGHFSLLLSYVIALVGIMLVATPITRNFVTNGNWQFSWSADIYVGLFSYLLVAPFVFFAPMSVAQKAMEKAKCELLAKIGHKFDTEYERVQKAIDEDSEDIEPVISNLNALGDLYQTTTNFPVWPFNTSNVTRFAASYLSPLALTLLPWVLDKVLDK